MKTKRHRKVMGYISFLTGAVLSFAGAAPPDEIPVLIQNALQQLRLSFHGMWDLEPHLMQKEVERNKSTINILLTYSKSFEENSRTLADNLLARLGNYAERFKPGKEIDENTLRTRSYVVGKEPDHGLNIDAYLLLELAKQKRSIAFTKRALSTLYGVVLACSYLAEKRTLNRTPGSEQEIDREKREMGGFGTKLGAEIAWYCEMFMVDQHLSDEPFLPQSAMDVVIDFWRWRKEIMVKKGRPYCLELVHQQRTMAYVKKLIDALPSS
ncbi:MAG: hypothetical protein HY318_08410 [Armatimonadetes bacterium]|nr:hypothetical protein [Armatimonadota bacterium]